MRRFPPLPVDDLFDVFPVPVDVIAKCYYGIEIVKRRLPDTIGAILYKLEGRSYLYLNSGHSPERQRFTVAHEIAHHRLHHLGIHMAMTGPGALSSHERAADGAAAAMLMPAWAVRHCLNEGMSLNEMARYFGVSREALRYRVEEVQEADRKRGAG